MILESEFECAFQINFLGLFNIVKQLREYNDDILVIPYVIDNIPHMQL